MNSLCLKGQTQTKYAIKLKPKMHVDSVNVKWSRKSEQAKFIECGGYQECEKGSWVVGGGGNSGDFRAGQGRMGGCKSKGRSGNVREGVLVGAKVL